MRGFSRYFFMFVFLCSLLFGNGFDIVSASPKQDAVNVSKYLPIVVEFTQDIDDISLIGNVGFMKNSDNEKVDFIRHVKDGNKLIIKPKNRLLNNTKYTISLTKQIKSKDGLTLKKPQMLNFTTSKSVGKISLYKGKASVKRGSKNLMAKLLMSIKNLDIVKTKKKTKLQLSFDDNTLITLGSKTVFKVVDYSNDTGNMKASFDVRKGYFKAISGNIGKISPQKFSLQTKTAIIGIRGTVFEGKIGTVKGGDFISCLDGEISVTSRKTRKTVILKRQQGVHVSKKGRIGKVQTVTSKKYK